MPLQPSQTAQPDWIYVLDADEFPLTGDGHLRETVAPADPHCTVVRYQVQNRSSNDDFDDADLSKYARLHNRSKPPAFAALISSTLVGEIWSGNLNSWRGDSK